MKKAAFLTIDTEYHGLLLQKLFPPCNSVSSVVIFFLIIKWSGIVKNKKAIYILSVLVLSANVKLFAHIPPNWDTNPPQDTAAYKYAVGVFQPSTTEQDAIKNTGRLRAGSTKPDKTDQSRLD